MAEMTITDFLANQENRTAYFQTTKVAKKCSNDVKDVLKVQRNYGWGVHLLNKQYSNLFSSYVDVCKALTTTSSSSSSQQKQQHHNHQHASLSGTMLLHSKNGKTIVDAIHKNIPITLANNKPSSTNHGALWACEVAAENRNGNGMHMSTFCMRHADENTGSGDAERDARDFVFDVLSYYRFTNAGRKRKHCIAEAMVTVKDGKYSSSNSHDGGSNHAIHFDLDIGDGQSCTVKLYRITPVYDPTGSNRYPDERMRPGHHGLLRDEKVAMDVINICSDVARFIQVEFHGSRLSHAGKEVEPLGFTIKVHMNQQVERPFATEDYETDIFDEVDGNGNHSGTDVVKIHFQQKKQNQKNHKKDEEKSGNENHHGHNNNSVTGVSLESMVMPRVAELQLNALAAKYKNPIIAEKAKPIGCNAQMVRNMDVNEYAWSVVKVSWSIPTDDGTERKIYVKTRHSLTLCNKFQVVGLGPNDLKQIDDDLQRLQKKCNEYLIASKAQSSSKVSVVGDHHVKHPAALSPRSRGSFVERGRKKNTIGDTPWAEAASDDEDMVWSAKCIGKHLDHSASLQALQEFEEKQRQNSASKFDLGSILGAAERVFSSVA